MTYNEAHLRNDGSGFLQVIIDCNNLCIYMYKGCNLVNETHTWRLARDFSTESTFLWRT